ncbi:MAG: hypothetical protein GY847_20605 [Proteobacteria bacterium]|nr:hypothetical protein [Pseudomonadota bacterium]
MMKRMYFTVVGLIMAWSIAACGGAGKDEVRWIEGEMPPNGNFDGVYQSDFGRLELTASGSSVVGLYESDQFSGRIEGEVEDNLLFFRWTQWNQEMRGKTRETKGEGVFQYLIDEVAMAGNRTKTYHRLEGWWGYDRGDMINRWNAAKLSDRAKKRLKPFKPEAYEMEKESNYEQSVGFGEGGGSSGGGGSEEEEEEEDEGNLDDVF